MNPRAIRLLLVLSAFLAGLVLCFAVVLLVTGRGSAPIIAAPSAIGGPFRLTDQNGKTITDQDLKGRPFLVFFGFTHCPEVCPTALFDISEILEQARARCREGQRAVRHGRSGARHAGEAEGVSVELQSAPDRRRRRRGRARGRRQGLPGLLQEGAAQGRRLHDGPHRDRVPDGQERPVRRAVQPEAAARGRGGRPAALSLMRLCRMHSTSPLERRLF